MRKRNWLCFLAACCMAAAFLALLLPSQRAAAAPEDDIIFIAVDEKFVPSGLSEDTMPVWRQGILYAPYNIFDYAYSTIDLGLYVAHQPDRGRVTLFNKSKSLSFYPGTQRIIDNNTPDGMMPYTTFYRNNRIYVPVQFTAQFFGLNTYQEQTDLGYVFRISGPAAAMDDQEFMRAAASSMKTYRDEYLKSIAPTPTRTPTPTPTRTPTPSPTRTPAPTPTPATTRPPVATSTPVPTPTPIPKSEIKVLLTFHHSEGGNAEEVLDRLDQAGVKGLFLFRPEELPDHADTVRRIVGTGHSIGFLAAGEDGEEIGEQLRMGNELLERIALSRTHIAAVPSGGGTAEELEAGGWICWQGNVDGIPGANAASYSLASAILRSVDGKRSFAHVTMDDSATAARALTRVLAELQSAGYNIRPAVETEI